MKKLTFKSGQWNAVCDVCGFEYKSSELKKDWRGLWVCSEDFEYRNEQDFLRVRPEKVTPPWTRPEPVDDFLLVCDLWRSQGRADFGVADCARTDFATSIDVLVDAFAPSSIANCAIASYSVPDVLTYCS